MQDVAPLTRASRTGFPALQRFLVDSVPFLQRLKPYLGQLVPVIDYINVYRREIAAFFANSTATTEGTLPSASGHNEHYLRAANTIGPDALMPYQARPQTNRSNAYMTPGGYRPSADGPAGVRQLPLHEPSAADVVAVAVDEHNFGDRDCVNNCAAGAAVLPDV